MFVTRATEDYTYLHFTETPQDEGTYTALDTRTSTYLSVTICPGSGVSCSILVIVNGEPTLTQTEKGKHSPSIEIL